MDGRKGFDVKFNWVKLLCSIDDVILAQDTSYCLVMVISFYNCVQGSMELGEDGSVHELLIEVLEGLLLLVAQ